MGKTFLIITTVCLLLSSSISAQVTIGSGTKPIAGALLDLKDGTPDPSSIGITASKGLGLPRVALQSPSGDLGQSLNAAVTTAGTLDKETHIGLLVYNTNSIETAARLCPGLHVWDGDKWQPLSPYPVFAGVEPSLAGSTSDLVDSRNGGAEINTYHTARFHTVKITSGNPYACDASNEPITVTYDAGIWMTQNLNTKFAPNGTAIPIHIENSYSDAQYITPENINADVAQIKTNGLLYNWAAATVSADGVHGKGGADGMQNTTNEGGTNEGARIQGICPPNWHLPSDKEYTELVATMTADPSLYTTAGSGVTANQPAFIWMKKENMNSQPDTGGHSKASNAGGFSGLLTGVASFGSAYGYSYTNSKWTSSSFNGTLAFYRGVDQGAVGISFQDNQRYILCSVRCKKN